MKKFIVILDLRIGEYEKNTRIIVNAKDEDDAGNYALYSESHCCDELDWCDNGVYDDWGGMYYCVSSVKELNKEEFDVLSENLPVMTYNQNDLNKAGNYKEMINENN